VKLIFDAMLSPSLPGRMSDLFPGSLHVFDVGLERSDSFIWEFARKGVLDHERRALASLQMGRSGAAQIDGLNA